MPLFKYSIAIQKSEILVDVEDDSVGNLKVIESQLIAKDECPLTTKIDSGEISFFKDLVAALRDVGVKESSHLSEIKSTDSKMLVYICSEVSHSNSSSIHVLDSNFGTAQIDGCTTAIYHDLVNLVIDPSESSSQIGPSTFIITFTVYLFIYAYYYYSSSID